MKIRFFMTIVLTVLLSWYGFSQAPGGVTGGNYMWLKAGTTYTPGLWEDSWNLHNMEQQAITANQPSLMAIDTNFNPAVSFDGSNDWLSEADNMFMTTNYSVYAVYSSTDNAGALFTVTNPVSPGSESHDRQFGFTSNGRFSNRIWRDQTITSPGSYNDGIAKVFNNRVSNSTTNNSLNGQENIVNGLQVVQGNKNASNFDFEAGYVLGGHTFWGYIEARVQEFIIINKDLTDAEQDRVESYLAIKYGISLGSTSTVLNYTASNGSTVFWTGDATYQNDVFGIGKDVTSLLEQKISQSVNNGAIVTMAIDADFTSSNQDVSRSAITDDLDFLMVGNNGENTNVQSTELDAAFNYFSGINREWKVQNTNFGQTVNLKFDGFASTPYAITYLIKKNGSDDFSTGTIQVGALDSNGEITGVTLNNGDYFTLATLNVAPGGVTDGLEIWLAANIGASTAVDNTTIATWLDQSKRSHTATGVNGPVYRDGTSPEAINFNPNIVFDGTAAHFDVTDGFDDFRAGISAFSVSNYKKATNWERIFDFGNGRGNNNILMARRASSSRFALGTYYSGNTGANATSSIGAIVNGVPFIGDVIMPAGNVGNVRSTNFNINGESFGSANAPIPGNVTRASNYIGRSNWSNDAYMQGNITEVILYSQALDAMQRLKVQSYLATKYGFTLNEGIATNYVATNDVVYWTGDAIYQNDIFGIGKDAGTALHQKISKSISSDALVTIALDPDFTSGNQDAARSDITTPVSYFMLGNNNGDTNISTTALSSLSPYIFRMNRVWKTQDTGGLGCLNYRFDTTGFTTSGTEDWYIVVSSDAAFTTNVEMRPITVGSNVDVTMDLDDNASNYITLARLDKNDIPTPGTPFAGIVGINTDTPANDTYLDIRGGNRGMVISRLDQNAINNLTAVEGMIVFNTSTSTFQLYNGTDWRALGGKSASSSKFCN